MKKFLAVLALAALLQGCDDGDLIFDDISLDDATPQSCNDIIYKIEGNQVMLFEIPDLNTVLPNQPTETPLTFQIGSVNRVIYRLYDGEPTSANFCETIQSPTPTVTRQLNAISGTIQISTASVIAENTAEGFEGGERITGLQHSILFLNANFDNGPITDPYDFGNYLETDIAAPNLAFGLDTTLEGCGNNVIFNKTLSRAIKIAIDPALLSAMALNTTQDFPVDGLTNVAYETYASDVTSLPAAEFCALPAVAGSVWTAVPTNVDNNSAIRVTKTELTSGSGVFNYTFNLINVYLQKGTLSFKIANDYFVGNYAP